MPRKCVITGTFSGIQMAYCTFGVNRHIEAIQKSNRILVPPDQNEKNLHTVGQTSQTS